MPKKAQTRKTFTQEDKDKALQMLREGHTVKQTAETIGCTVASLYMWKGNSKPKKKAAKKKAAKAHKAEGMKKHHQLTYDEFFRKYWTNSARAADVVLLPPDTMATVVGMVNNALKYGYEQFHKR
jgi:hypothetical protein